MMKRNEIKIDKNTSKNTREYRREYARLLGIYYKMAKSLGEAQSRGSRLVILSEMKYIERLIDRLKENTNVNI